MSEGRQKRTATAKTTGTSKESILGNLTLASGKREDLTRDTYTYTKSAGFEEGRDLVKESFGYDSEGVGDGKVRSAQNIVNAQAQKKANTLFHLSQDQVDSLNVKFKQRAADVLSRNTFKGREQLVLTDRI